jgi:hypothetical protein
MRHQLPMTETDCDLLTLKIECLATACLAVEECLLLVSLGVRRSNSASDELPCRTPDPCYKCSLSRTFFPQHALAARVRRFLAP